MVASSVSDIKMSRVSCQPNAYDVKLTASDVRLAACDVSGPGGTISQPPLDFNARRSRRETSAYFFFLNRLNINKKIAPRNQVLLSFFFFLFLLLFSFPLKMFIYLFELIHLINIRLAEIFAALKQFPIIDTIVTVRFLFVFQRNMLKNSFSVESRILFISSVSLVYCFLHSRFSFFFIFLF